MAPKKGKSKSDDSSDSSTLTSRLARANRLAAKHAVEAHRLSGKLVKKQEKKKKTKGILFVAVQKGEEDKGKDDKGDDDKKEDPDDRGAGGKSESSEGPVVMA